MPVFEHVDRFSYRVCNTTETPSVRDPAVPLCSYISECTNDDCIYNRSITDLRERFEKKILAETNDRSNITILFYGSFLLRQEFNIIQMIYPKLSEIHFVDNSYENLHDQFVNAFEELQTKIDPRIVIYIHTNPVALFDSKMFRRRFDIICGIDIDGEICRNNRPVMKKIAENTLMIDGVMIMSQHHTDLIDLCKYELSDKGDVRMMSSEDFVKEEYYTKYHAFNIIKRISHLTHLVGIAGSTLLAGKIPIIAGPVGIYLAISFVHKFMYGNLCRPTITVRKIDEIMKQ